MQLEGIIQRVKGCHQVRALLKIEAHEITDLDMVLADAMKLADAVERVRANEPMGFGRGGVYSDGYDTARDAARKALEGT